MVDAGSPQSALAQQVGQFFGWWKTQLWECIPASWRRKAIQARRPAMWAPGTDQVWAPAASAVDSQAFTRSVLAQGGGAVALVAGENNGFRRIIDLPVAVADRLQQVLGFELDRLTPLRASELYYDFRLVDRNAAAGSCRVEVVAVPRNRIAPWLADAQQKNLQVTRLVLSAADIDSSLNLLASAHPEQVVTSRLRWLNPLLIAVCAILAIALVAFPLWQMREQTLALMPVEASAKVDAEAASVLQQQLEKQLGAYNLPLARKHGAPLVLQVIDDISKRLPDDTWAQSFEIKSVPNQKTREVIVQGETGSGGKILQWFQESPLLKDPVFKASMTRVAPNAERFHISGELVAAEMPKPLLLSDASAVITVIPGASVAPATPAGAPSTAKSVVTAAPAAQAGAVAPIAPGIQPAGGSADVTRKANVPTSGAMPGNAPGNTPAASGEKRP